MMSLLLTILDVYVRLSAICCGLVLIIGYLNYRRSEPHNG